MLSMSLIQRILGWSVIYYMNSSKEPDKWTLWYGIACRVNEKSFARRSP